MGFPDSSVGKESTYNAGDPSSISELERSAGDGIVYSLQCSVLENNHDYAKAETPILWPPHAKS